MEIYEAVIEYNEFDEPDDQIGIFSDLETAKEEIFKGNEVYLDQTAKVYVLKLEGKKFMLTGVWSHNKTGWEFSEHT